MPTLKRETTEDDVARRAHEISQSDERGSDDENWRRAERELQSEPDESSPFASEQPAGTDNANIDSAPDGA